jgi:mRNA deadenylase 3'-5' endonuclease subunit Ccr4
LKPRADFVNLIHTYQARFQRLGLFFSKHFKRTMSVFPLDEVIPNEIRQNISIPSLRRRFLGNYSLKPGDRTINVLQWNILAQALSYPEGNFNRVKTEMVAFETRKWRILEQILIHQPDLCSLEEMDIYDCFLKDQLPKYGYNCFFTPKHNSK